MAAALDMPSARLIPPLVAVAAYALLGHGLAWLLVPGRSLLGLAWASAVAGASVLVLGRLGALPPEPQRDDALQGWVGGGWVGGLGLGLLGGGAALYGQILLAFCLSGVGLAEVPEPSEVTRAAAQSAPWLLALALVAAAPLSEELVFRRLLFAALRARGRLLAYLGSSAVFALMHLEPRAMLLYLWTGLVLGLVYELGGILAACVAHAALNGLLLMALLRAN